MDLNWEKKKKRPLFGEFKKKKPRGFPFNSEWGGFTGGGPLEKGWGGLGVY